VTTDDWWGAAGLSLWWGLIILAVVAMEVFR